MSTGRRNIFFLKERRNNFVPNEIDVKQSRPSVDLHSGHELESSDSIPSSLFCSCQRSSKQCLQLVGKFGDDRDLYHILKAADRYGFEQSIHFK